MSANGSPDHALNTLERCASMSHDELAEYAASLARRLDSISGEQREELAERKYKEGFDAGIAYQKRADPPPKAHALKRQLVELAKSAQQLIANIDSLCTCDEDGEHPRCDLHASVDEFRRLTEAR